VVINLRFFFPSSLVTEIKTLYGQPSYHSVDLTWEVEDKYADNRINSDDEEEHETEPRSFMVNYCEIQGFDLQRCNSKIVADADDEVEFEKCVYTRGN
jgi:hypothetical protein